MFESIFGLLLLVIPFVLVLCFKDKKLAFLYVLIGSICVHIVVSLVTLGFNIFYYPLIISVYSIIAVGCLLYFIRNRQPNTLSSLKINWFGVVALLIVLLQLGSVHFFYSGAISTISGFEVVERSTNLRPYFSDEWVGVSLVNYSIRTRELPLANPLYENIPFLNPFVAFYSVTAELFLLLNLDPVLEYAYMPLLGAFLLLLSIYLYLSTILKDRYSPYLAILAAPLIVNGSNLPGIWFHLPFLGSLTLFLLALTAYRLKKVNLFWGTSLVSLFIYPPLVVFVLPAATWILFDSKFDKKILAKFLLPFVGAIAVLFIVLSTQFEFKAIYSFIVDVAIRDSVVNGIASYPIWIVMPISILVFALIGIAGAIKDKKFEIIFPLIAGGALWIYYTYSRNVFIVDHPRTVVITSLILLLFFSIGFSVVFRAIIFRYPGLKIFLLIVTGMCFAATILLYPSMKWINLMLQVPKDGGISLITPASPVTDYLTKDDLRLFAGISNERFISHPWKGLAIGAATNNYPLESKTSTISNLYYPYSFFIVHNCTEKTEVVSKYNIAYVYAPAFNCSGFDEVGHSDEGYYLYKVKKE